MKKHRTREERAELVRAWRASGQSAAAFCRSRGVTESSLYRWVAEARGEAKGMTPLSFVRVAVKAAKSPHVVVEVGGAKIGVSGGFDPALLRAVVKALGEEGEG
jgi:transposase-like protein